MPTYSLTLSHTTLLWSKDHLGNIYCHFEWAVCVLRLFTKYNLFFLVKSSFFIATVQWYHKTVFVQTKSLSFNVWIHFMNDPSLRTHFIGSEFLYGPDSNRQTILCRRTCVAWIGESARIIVYDNRLTSCSNGT